MTRTARLSAVAIRIGQRVALVVLVGLATAFFTLLAIELARGTSLPIALSRAGQAFLDYTGRLLHGDLGMTQVGGSTSRRFPVAQVLAETLLRSLGLLGVTLGFSTLAGIGLGILAAVSKRNLGASFLLFCSILGASTPSFFLALLLQLLVLKVTRAVGHSVLPVGGFGWGAELVLPTLVLAARPISQIARITFIKIRETSREDFVRTAFGKGLGLAEVLRRHVARNVAVPILTTAAVSLRFALGSLPIVEVYFGWPGAGLRLMRAISDKDDNLAVALLLALALVFLVVQVVLGLTYPVLDPRLAKGSLSVEEHRASLRGLFAAAVDGVKALALVPHRWLRDVAKLVARLRPRHRRPRLRREQRLRNPGRFLRRLNPALIVGGILCSGVLFVVFFGPILAPHNPYLTLSVEKVDGIYKAPPFEPSARFPWGTDGLGRDLLSLVLVGAQQTLLLAGVAVAARMAVGVALGAIAGWRRGSLMDRAITGLAQVITPFPILLLAMLIILAVGIRQGVRPFAIGLCVVGWGELAQFVRAEVIVLKSRPFVESARAVGASAPRLIAAHLLPHLTPSLVALAAIEFSSVLMLLGELGFLGIFLGGGTSAEVNAFSPLLQYSDIPEWGALLANFRQSARAHPWLVMYPSLAIFISSFGFHLLGEGIRREIERGHLFLRRVFNRYTFAGAAAAGVVFYFLSGNLGPAAVYRKDAALFDGERAVAHVAALCAPELGGREIGSAGADQAAAYIAEEFKRLGVQAVGEAGTYFLAGQGGFEKLSEVPALELNDGGAPLRYEVDFAEYGDRFRCLGEAEGVVRFVAFGSSPSLQKVELSAFGRLDLSNDVILVLSPEDAEIVASRACAGVLVVASNQEWIERPSLLSPESRPGIARSGSDDSLRSADRASFWISEAVAERLLAGSGWTLGSLRRRSTEVGAKDPLTFMLPRRAALRAVGSALADVPIRHVVGWVPGLQATGSDPLDRQVVAVLAQYDTLPTRPTAAASQGANDNASGVAVLLELARLLTQSEYLPNRSFLLVAYSAVGWEGGESRAELSAGFFLSRLAFPTRNFTIEAVVRLRALGKGISSRLSVETSGSLRLSNLFRFASSRVGVTMVVAEKPAGLQGSLTAGGVTREQGSAAPEAILSYSHWQAVIREGDPPESIDSRALERAGKAASLGLMILGRERQY